MIRIAFALLAGAGTYLAYTAIAFDWRGVGPRTAARERHRSPAARVDAWLVQAGLDDVDRREFAAVVVMLATLGTLVGYAVFGGVAPALVIGGFAASFPVASYRLRRRNRRARAQEAWPRLIEEIRILTTSLGRSIPQALFEVGNRGPDEMRGAFDAAHREWLISTDFARTLAVIKERLADPTADMTCETLLIAHELGGTDIGQRLEALAEDRRQDTQGRKDARARQAGARFARWFVLGVPAGMALAGMSIGTGRASYQSPSGQVLVVAAIALVIGCWVWAGRIMALPDEQRVFHE